MGNGPDHEAREDVVRVEATLEAHLKECTIASERNEADHERLFASLSKLKLAAWLRWFGVVIPLLGGMAMIIYNQLATHVHSINFP